MNMSPRIYAALAATAAFALPAVAGASVTASAVPAHTASTVVAPTVSDPNPPEAESDLPHAPKKNKAKKDRTKASDLTLPDGSYFDTQQLYPVSSTLNVFDLNSKKGSPRTIYLNFKGKTVGGTNGAYGSAWSSTPQYVPAWSLDADRSTFNATERAVIYYVWRTVMEQYASQDVNVTTAVQSRDAIERDGAADLTYGTDVLISDSTNLNATKCQCAGQAFVGVFDSTNSTFNPTLHQKYQPAIVYTKTGNLNTPSRIAVAAAHEIGHTVGLSHDGDVDASGNVIRDYSWGNSVWAPTMGAAYDKPIYTFNRGTYSGASNLEDDYVKMNSNGLSLRAADAPLTKETAKPLTRGVPSYHHITAASQQHWFKVAHPGGTFNLRAWPQSWLSGTKTDLSVAVYNPAGTLVKFVNPVTAYKNSQELTGADASVYQTLPAGTYYVRVMNTGGPGYTSYDTRGTYVIRWNL